MPTIDSCGLDTVAVFWTGADAGASWPDTASAATTHPATMIAATPLRTEVRAA